MVRTAPEVQMRAQRNGAYSERSRFVRNTYRTGLPGKSASGYTLAGCQTVGVRKAKHN